MTQAEFSAVTSVSARARWGCWSKVGELTGGLSKLWSFLGPYYNTGPNTGPNLGDPKRDHNFDNPPTGLL